MQRETTIFIINLPKVCVNYPGLIIVGFKLTFPFLYYSLRSILFGIQIRAVCVVHITQITFLLDKFVIRDVS